MNMNINRRGLLVGAAAVTAGGVTTAMAPAWAQSAGAETRTNHALLVAVTAYPNLPPKATLVGPNNDAALVRDFLTASATAKFEPSNVTVLADGIEANGSPNREGIQGALAALTEKVVNGDFVYLHFSGHGTQQPSMDASSEADGLDECFLPADTGLWKDRSQGIPNALIDKEIRDHLQAIRDKGAFIWAVFDCCHSGTMTRAAGAGDEDITERKVDFTDLGISEKDMRAAIAQGEGASRGIGDQTQRQNSLGIQTPTGADSIAPAGMVAFFAAQTVETTPEMLLPRNSENATKLGLFTHTIFQKIAENPAMTYRQLGQAILQAYSADNRTRPTPLFEGDLDKPVFGTSAADRLAQWPIKAENGGLSVAAGLLHRLDKGAKLAVLPGPGSTIDDARGYVEVVSAKNLTSTLRPVEYENMPALAITDIQPGDYVRLQEVQIGFELIVARPGGDAFGAEVDILNAALDRIVSGNEMPVNLRLVAANEPADLKLAVMSEMDVGIAIAEQRQDEEAITEARASLSTEPLIWMLPPSAELSLDEGRRPPSLPIPADPEAIVEALSQNLVSIFRATSLSRLSAASDYRPEEVSVGFNVLRGDTGAEEPLQPGAVPIVHPADQIHIAARNSSSKPVDVNVLYVGSDYSISHMYAERLHGGSEITLPLLQFNDSSFGIERMIVVLGEAQPQSAVEDLSFLEQIGVRTMTRAAGVGAAGFGDLLRDVAGAPATRGAAKLGGNTGAKGAVMIFPMENLPRA
jgi:hypothetical protein